jgi:long-chain fatty acid transport protein
MILVPGRNFAEGFRNPPPGSFNLGRAGGRIAHIDDSSAITQNPANLVDVAKPEFQFTPTVVYYRVNYDSPSGQSARTIEPWKLLPNLFGSLPLADGKYAFGLGITTPYGIANEYEEKGAFAPGGTLRYTSANFGELMTINLNPTFSAKVHERIRVGMGLDVMWSQLELEQFYPWFLITANPADPDGDARVKGDGVGFGGNLGITWDITERQRLAVTYRSPIKIRYEGDFSVNHVPAALGGGKSRSDFETEIEFPTIVAAGYGIQVTDNIRVEVGVEWLEFSNFDKLPLDIDTPPPGISSSVRHDWDDTFTVGIGADWRFHPDWVLRAGYQYYESPVPNRTYSPLIPDSDQNVFTVGLGYRHKKHSFEAAYGLDFYDDRKITSNQNPAFNGKYELNVHLFSAAYRYRF